MNYLAEFFLKNYKFTLVLSVFVVIFGLAGLTNIKSETFPSVNIGAVTILTRYDGATAEDMETKITRPLEEEIQTVSGLKRVTSTSQPGLSTIVTEVDIDRYDVEEVIADLQRAVDRASGLPPDLPTKPLFTEIKSDEFPVIEVAVVGANEGRLRDKVADLLREELKDNQKVSSVLMTGFRERQFNILLDRSALQRNHVAISEVYAALTQRNLTIPAGEIKSAKDQKLVRLEGKAKTKEELEQIIVRSNFSGQRVMLKDIAQIEDGSEDPVTLTHHNGQPATLLTITKKGGADILELAKEVKATIASFSEKYKGQLEFAIFNNEGLRVGDRLDVLISNGYQGIILVILFLLLFMPGKVGLMASFSLPLTLAATLGAVYTMGYTLNTITIVALVIAIGMLVDNSVVIAENFTRLRGEGLDTDEALLKTVADLWAPITATVLTTVAAFVPMLVTTGIMGQFIKAIPIVVSLALMISLFESFFLLPMRLKLVGYQPKATGGVAQLDWVDRWVIPTFRKHLVWVVANRWKAAGILSGLVLATFVLMATGLKVNLFPTDQTEVYIGRLETKQGTRVEETLRIAAETTAKIQEKLEGKALHIVTISGQSIVDLGDPKAKRGNNTAMIKIFVNRETQYGVLTKDMLDLLRSVEHPELSRISFEALVNGPPVGDPVTVVFRSNDADQLDQVVTHILKKVSSTPGIFDAQINDVIGDDEVSIVLNHEQSARLGLSLQDVGFNVRTAIAGLKTGDVNLLNREVDYFLRFGEQDRTDITNLSAVKISDRMGNLIPLSNVAQFNVQPGAPFVRRYDFRRARTVTANLDDTVITSIEANELIAKEFAAIKDRYKDVSMIFGGEQEKTNESVASLLTALILSLIGIFALMVLIFRSFLSPLIILTTIPLGLVGVTLSFFLHGMDFSFMAIIGVIGLGGIIVNAGIILISFIEQMREETNQSLDSILVDAAVLRLKSVLVTSLTTISGLVPTAYAIGGSDYFIIPMAMALAWGLTSGTLLTLYWIPPVYGIVADLTSKLNRGSRAV